MAWFKNNRMECRLTELEQQVRALQDEVSFLRSASTMRVGTLNEFRLGYYRTDPRPVLTAVQAIEKLMQHAGIEAHEVPPRAATVEFVQSDSAASSL